MRGWSYTHSFLLLCSNPFARWWKPLVSEDSSLLAPGPSTPLLSWKCGIISRTKLSYGWTAAVQRNICGQVVNFPAICFPWDPKGFVHPLSLPLERACCESQASATLGQPAQGTRQGARWMPWGDPPVLGDPQPPKCTRASRGEYPSPWQE